MEIKKPTDPVFEGMNPAQIAEHNERKIVKFKNIDKEDFTHAFRGIRITVRAGAEYMGRFPEADHLALHLARKMLSRERKRTMSAQQRAAGTHLYTTEEVDELKAKMIFPIAEEGAESMTPEQKREQDLKNIGQRFNKPPEAPKPSSAKDVTKEEVIAELKKRGSDVDETKSKAELLKQLIDLEAQGK